MAFSTFTPARQAPSFRRESAQHGSALRRPARAGPLHVGAALKWKKEKKSTPEGEINSAGFFQLLAMGLGTVAGDITEINLDDPARTVVMELEANNFEDKDGNPLALKFMNNDGVVDEESEPNSMLNVAAPAVLGALSLAGVLATLKALS
jgi:hypothetical protein